MTHIVAYPDLDGETMTVEVTKAVIQALLQGHVL
jgi:hypothetical protein